MFLSQIENILRNILTHGPLDHTPREQILCLSPGCLVQLYVLFLSSLPHYVCCPFPTCYTNKCFRTLSVLEESMSFS